MTVAERFWLGIDLAERHSAAVLLDDKYQVRREWVVDVGAAEKPPRPEAHFEQLNKFWLNVLPAINDRDVVVGMEDIHPFAVNPKPALRLQGALLFCMWSTGWSAGFVKVSDWQRHHGYRKQKGRTSKGWAKEMATELGYVPGEDLKGKQVVDTRDAYLIARYLRDLDTQATVG